MLWRDIELIQRLGAILGCFFFFFFKQKTAYEMLRSLVGSEMCIRDRGRHIHRYDWGTRIQKTWDTPERVGCIALTDRLGPCLLYTSDAADDLLCVDLGGRRIIKKKTPHFDITLNRHLPSYEILAVHDYQCA
mgnify:CR=1 FL=1